MKSNAVYINNNGILINASTPSLTSCNRAFRYGDALFETMHSNGVTVQFLHEHCQRLTASMEMLKMIVPGHFTTAFLESEIARLVNKNKMFLGNRIRFTVYRADGGHYSPLSNDIGFLIEVEPLTGVEYTMNKKGLVIDIFDELKKSRNFLSNLKTANSLLFVMASHYKTENNLDDCILLNDSGGIAEAIASNIFLVKNNCLFTPALTEGCVAGVMRKVIIGLAISMDYKVKDDCHIKPTDLPGADEIFLTNAIAGIKWVVAYKQQRYFNALSVKLTRKLNEVAFL